MEDKKIKVAFDAKRITHNGTGLGNYGRTLVNNLVNYGPEWDYLLYSPDPGADKFRTQVVRNEKIKFVYPEKKKKGIFKSIWRSFGILKELDKEKPALFHGLSGELPFGIKKAPVRSIVTIHDLIFLRFPELYNPLDRIIYTYKYKKACREADRIIAISETTKKDIVSYFGISPEKIDIVYQGCNDSFKKEVSASEKTNIKRKYNLPDQYILYLGTIEERKNLLLLLKALKFLPYPVPVVAIGKTTPYAEKVFSYIKENHLNEQVTILSGVPFEDLPALYQMASVFVYPSRFEGFGIPILEAIHSGVPVIACTGSCLEEAGGTECIYVGPDDEKGLAESIDKVLSDPAKREQMIADSKKYVTRFEDPVLVRDLLEVYRKVLNE